MSAGEQFDEVVVGVDGSDDSRHALRWALDPAKDLGHVRTVAAYSVAALLDGWVLASANNGLDLFRESADERALKIVREFGPSTVQTHRTVEGPPGQTLVQASTDAALLVLGCRGRGVVKEVLLGSVGSYCVKHSEIPVVIVPDNVKAEGPLKRLVVGIDGSDNSNCALRWALDHVAEDGTVVATCAAQVLDAYEVRPPAWAVAQQKMKARVARAVAAVATDQETRRTITTDIRFGDPRTELDKAARHADALVVGARGHRGIAHLLLGSVTTALVHHPRSVTVVVPR